MGSNEFSGGRLWFAGNVALSVVAIIIAALLLVDGGVLSQDETLGTLDAAWSDYDCQDSGSLASLRAVEPGEHGLLWIGDVGIYLPPDAIGHDVVVLGGGPGGAVKMAVIVREGVEFENISMRGEEVRSGTPVSFEYDGSGYIIGPASFRRPERERPFYGSIRVSERGVYRLTYALDGVEQGSTLIALCRGEGAPMFAAAR